MPLFQVNSKLEFDNEINEPFFHFTLLSNPAYKVSFKFINPDVESVSAGRVEQNLKPLDTITIWAGPHNQEPTKIYFSAIEIGEVKFQDIDGRQYSQKIFKQGSAFSISYPYMLK